MSEAGRTDLARLLRMAARAFGRHGLAHAYGRTARVDSESFLVCPPQPMGLIAPGDACTVVRLDDPLPDGVLGEMRIHREIYRLRLDVGGVVRCMSPKAISFAAMGMVPRARHGFGSYFHPHLALWDDPQLLRSDEQATALAVKLGDSRAILMRGNGVVTAGTSIEEAVVLAWYLEDAARVEGARKPALLCPKRKRASGRPGAATFASECGSIRPLATRSVSSRKTAAQGLIQAGRDNR